MGRLELPRINHWFLRPARLPVPPHSHIGVPEQIRTAGLTLRRRLLHPSELQGRILSQLAAEVGFEPTVARSRDECLTSLATPQFGWGGRIRTHAWRIQSPPPYRLATPQNTTGLIELANVMTCGLTRDALD